MFELLYLLAPMVVCYTQFPTDFQTRPMPRIPLFLIKDLSYFFASVQFELMVMGIVGVCSDLRTDS